MTGAKFTGSYYTPEILSDFLISHITTKYVRTNHLRVLEPSCGDGQFVKSLFNTLDITDFNNINIDLIDIDAKELAKACEHIPSAANVHVSALAEDFLSCFLREQKYYNLIIGNPPYIRKRHMKHEQADLCEQCHDFARNVNPCLNSKFKISNIWTVFMELSILSLSKDGVLCFVLPSDILQVNYAKEIRELIQHEFERVEIFTFKELVFDNIQQDVVAVVAIKKVRRPEQKGFSFYHVENLNDLKEPSFTEKYNHIHRTSLNKWTNYLLSPAELDLIEPLRNRFYPISHYCQKISAGIVTAANEFFIVNNKTLLRNGLENYEGLHNVLLKSSLISPLVGFYEQDFEKMKNDNERVYFIQSQNIEKTQLPTNLQSYINQAEHSNKIHKRFKMKERTNWYHVPNIWLSDLLFAKRCDQYPRLIYNVAGVVSTDSFYRIIPKENIDNKSLVFCFYNSLSLLLAEMEGRYYGGGVLELTPNEFKKLAVPYNSAITEQQFRQLDEMFRNNISLEDILCFTDNILLPDIELSVLNRLRSLRRKLVNRRRKSSATELSLPVQDLAEQCA